MATKTKTQKKTSKPAAPKRVAAKKSTTRKKTPGKNGVSHDDIAQQAYMLWLERGGNEMENWLEAERQLQ